MRHSCVTDDWGPLAPLAGEWAGEDGVDIAYSHSRGEVRRTPYREKVSLRPFGPVDNGCQRLFGLDYSTAMWCHAETTPFHTEVGYWLWDAASGEVLRGFVVPRGVAVLAGGTAAADAVELRLGADPGGTGYTIGENRYLARHARTLSYRARITIDRNGSWSYDEVTMLAMSGLAEPFAHADRNTLRRVE
jgi:hypothetical protein